MDLDKLQHIGKKENEVSKYMIGLQMTSFTCNKQN